MKKDSFMKDALVLCLITLIAGGLLGGVYELTKGPIEQAQIAASLETYREVYPTAANFEADDALTAAVEGSADALAASGLSLGRVEINDALRAVDEGGNVIGYIISSTSKEGYGGDIQISIGVTAEGEITGLGFLSISETAGLGMRATEPAFKDQFAGKTAEQLVLTKGGAAADDEIDAMSGATVTSTAVTNAVNAALYFVHSCIGQ